MAIGIPSGQVDPTVRHMNGGLRFDGAVNDAIMLPGDPDLMDEEMEQAWSG